jgi:glycosyltransferase involved in cell wall biosynthesis
LLVSVYLPTHNRVERLARAVESVLSQSYDRIELIVVDDASSDGTVEFLKQRSRVDSRLTFVTNATPRGAPAARNVGIMSSRGTFVTGLDDDDEFLPGRIVAFVDYWNGLMARGIKSSCLYAQEVWTINGTPRFTTQKRSVVTAPEMFESNHVGNQIFAPRHHFIEAGLFDEKMPAWQDFEFFIRVLDKFGPAYLVDQATYSYDATPRSDRLSEQPKRIRKAFELIVAKHSGSAAQSRALFLLVFQGAYKIPPGLEDWTKFLLWGGWPKGIARLLRATIANRLRRLIPPSSL